MKTPYFVTDRTEYDYITARGYQPLVDILNFKLEINLRVEIQKEVFGHCVLGLGNIPQANERFYRWVWANKIQVCEETMKPLRNYSAIYISHILSRGAFPDIAHDPRNINILSADAHNIWENGKRERMRIYPGNIRIIELLKSDYQNIKRDKEI